MTERCIASAPGKIILFGEHAVVHGVTAIAASLSDLRIYADITVTKEPSLAVYLHDFSEKGPQQDPYIVAYSSMIASLDQGAMKRKATPQTPSNPDEDLLETLRREFEVFPLHAAQGLMAVAYLVMMLLPEFLNTENGHVRGLRIEVKSVGLPIGGGLGSSAAFSVALSGALLGLRQKTFKDVYGDEVEADLRFTGQQDLPVSVFESDFIERCGGKPAKNDEFLTTVNGWAYAAEVVIHGAPSGLDNTTSCFGGALKYQRNTGSFERLPHLPDVKIVLTNTKVPRSTKKLVAGVKELLEAMPGVVRPMFAAVEDISQRFLSLISSGQEEEEAHGESRAKLTHAETVQEMSQLVRINHCLLNAMGVGHAALDEVFAVSARHGFACKLTGAGGGGCAISLLDDTKDTWEADREKLRQEIDGLGYDTFLSSIGGEGLLWHL